MNNVFPIKTHLVDEEPRLIDEMALTLLGVAKLGSDEACILALIDAGFRSKDIGQYLDTARDLARATIAAGFSEQALP